MEQQLEIVWESSAPSVPSAISPIYFQPTQVPDSQEDGIAGLTSSAAHYVSAHPLDQTALMPLVAELLDQATPPIQGANLADLPAEQQRVKQLEQALYQCQLYIDELKQKLIDQSFLEEQLATTEAFSHIQKQAIETLKAQVEEQQSLQAELMTLRQQVQVQSSQADAIAKEQEAKVSMLQRQFLKEQAEVDRLKDKTAQLTAQLEALQSAMVQETQQRIIAQKTAERLRLEMRNHDAGLRSLETKLERAESMLTHREEMIIALKDSNCPDSQKDQFIQGLSSTLLKAQRQITELENELTNQSILQAQLQHTTYELEQDTKVTQVRSDQLEQQVHDLQEQVLRQAQQASEYETAVQHWKNRCLEAEDWTMKLAQLSEGLRGEMLADEMGSDFTQTLGALTRWVQGSQSNLSPVEMQTVSPKDLLEMRPRWQKF